MTRARFFLLACPLFCLLGGVPARAVTNYYRAFGYLYLSPLPGAEYTSPQTKFILVRFENIPPFAVTNLS